MTANKIEWAECPYCKVFLNGYDFYPASLIMNDNRYGKISSCPKCKKTIALDCHIEIKFEASEWEQPKTTAQQREEKAFESIKMTQELNAKLKDMGISGIPKCEHPTVMTLDTNPPHISCSACGKVLNRSNE